MVVTPGDPRSSLTGIVQIGEGSTGIVVTAYHVRVKTGGLILRFHF